MLGGTVLTAEQLSLNKNVEKIFTWAKDHFATDKLIKPEIRADGKIRLQYATPWQRKLLNPERKS